jgi:hypothetical protein
VGIGPDPGGDPDQDLLQVVGLAADAVEELDLGQRVADHMADAGVDREAQLGLALVVAVHVDPRRVEAGPQRHVQLAPGGDVDREPLLLEDPVGGRERRRLARIDHLEVVAAVAKGRQVGASAGAQVVLGVEVGGGAELACELDHVAASDLEVAAVVDPAADRVHRRPLDRVRVPCRLARTHAGEGL